MTGAFEFLVTMMSEVETNIVSVERVKEYTETPRELRCVCVTYAVHSTLDLHPILTVMGFNVYCNNSAPGHALRCALCSTTGHDRLHYWTWASPPLDINDFTTGNGRLHHWTWASPPLDMGVSTTGQGRLHHWT
ncbi:canalicular multispecific organic anion transporter 2 [Biomphalaria pfeifferi]|uniref:Canalicular multispecific organic anion transporter 2 n=1 Tax=Biomphalaria pfeifferi TaxID=112525 RepID=A0AAD8F5K6_BIOPF|nr:canalicular multispecific organic anion transporter 2 [Biomphalaria pfeifferi]